MNFNVKCDCGGEPTYENYRYTCQSCGNWVLAHKETNDYCLEHAPLGYMTDKEGHLLRNKLKGSFNKLWFGNERVFHNNKDKSLIEAIYPDFIIQVGEDDHVFGVSIAKNILGELDVQLVYTKEVISVPKEKLNVVSNRTKSHVWLSLQLGLSYAESNIHELSKENLKKAIEIVDKAIANVYQEINK
jgi:hypothetical protein